jgi:hypothetical protein
VRRRHAGEIQRLQRQATAAGRPLRFAGAPAQLHGLADFLGLRALLPLDTTGA